MKSTASPATRALHYVTTDTDGSSTRGFEVLVPRVRKPALRYPATGHPLHTGREAIAMMTELTRRGLSPLARTGTGFEGETETLTLDEMLEVVL